MHARAGWTAVAVGGLLVAVTVPLVAPSLVSADVVDPLGCDFDGDGYADLAVGVPAEDASNLVSSGAVNVIYGTAAGLSAGDNQILDQGADTPGRLESGDGFGRQIACGDVDGDGDDELVVGSPGENYASKANPGTIHVIPGTTDGLDVTSAVMIHRATPGIDGGPRAGEEWGYNFELGDVNGDGYDDLVVGSLHLDDAYVYIPGSAAGLDPTSSTRITEDPATAADEWFVHGVADVTGDGFDDLVLQGYVNTGSRWFRRYQVVPGSAGGPDWASRAPFSAGSDLTFAGIVDLNDDDRGDLLTMGPGGYVMVAPGSATGLDDAVVYLDLAGTTSAGRAEAIAGGDIDGEGREDVAVGDSGADVGVPNAGAAIVIPQTGGGPGSAVEWHQDVGTIEGTAQNGDDFGATVVIADFNGDGYGDLAVGAPRDGLGAGRPSAGSVNVIYGSASGLTDVGNQMWHQGTPDIAGALEAYDYFGLVLAD